MNEVAELEFEKLKSAVLDILASKSVGPKSELLYYQLLVFHLSVTNCAEIQQAMGPHIENLRQNGGSTSKLEFFSNVIADSLVEMTELLRLEMERLYDVVQEAPPA